ncbi:hypothetical protein IEQ34_013040 [Dendrobium chrysotoxum]|uniref:Uncharacterized protein n=1 Tax=Dendrobium chrysotoxum TaxID=161865 RepID=A0AAV7G778_DENCH|nr:hypothetical protein IEQ34_013040 [Dendrobium chrysotoxum]
MVNCMYDLIYPPIGLLAKSAETCDHFVLRDSAVVLSTFCSPARRCSFRRSTVFLRTTLITGYVLNALDRGKRIHATAINEGFYLDIFVGNSLVEMTGDSLFRRAKKTICRGGSSRGGSSRGESSMETESITPSTPVHPNSQEEIECSGSQQTSRHSFCGTAPSPEEGDPMLAPIAFPDWRNKGMEPFKKKMLAEVEILQSLGVKWRNYKTTLKAEHWDSKPIEEILEIVPAGVDQTQWCQLVNQWLKPEDHERAAKNSANVKKQTCPHTMGRTQACKLLAKEGLTPEDGNIKANERVFAIVMGPEHSEGGGNGSNFGQIASLREEFRSFRDNQMREFGLFRDEMRQFMQGFQMNHPPHGGSEMGGNDNSSDT